MYYPPNCAFRNAGTQFSINAVVKGVVPKQQYLEAHLLIQVDKKVSAENEPKPQPVSASQFVSEQTSVITL